MEMIKINGKKYSINDTLDRSQMGESVRNLLSEIEATTRVVFSRDDQLESWCSVFGKDSKKQRIGVIFMNTDYVDSYAAHELLHLKTGLKVCAKEIVYQMNQSVLHDSRLKKLFSYREKNNPIDEISNNQEHLSFYKEYIDMGLPEEGFFMKPEEQFNEITDKHSAFIKKFHLTLKKDLDFVASYFSSAFSTMLLPDRTRYSKVIEELKTIDSMLFRIFDEFRKQVIQAWQDDNPQDSIIQADTKLFECIIDWMDRSGI